jgi:hypothetical protein
VHHIRSEQADVIVVPITTALYPLPPVEYLAAYMLLGFQLRQKIDVAASALQKI